MLTYRNGKVTGASFVRESRRLDHIEEGIHFQIAFAKNSEIKERLERQLADVRKMQSDLYTEYKKGR